MTDPEDRRRARLLNILIAVLGLIAIMANIVLGLTFLMQADQRGLIGATLFSALAFLVSLVLVYILNRSGRSILASVVFISILAVAIFFAGTPAEMVENNLMFFILPLIISGVLLRPIGLIYTTATILLTALLVILVYELPLVRLVTLMAFVAISFVLWVSAVSLNRAVSELRGVNEELDRRVARRTRELQDANTQLSEQTEELEAANAQLKELDNLKSKFVSDVSHELRTPISNLAIYLEMLEESGPEQSGKYLPVLRGETTRLTQMVEDVLNISRIELDSMRFQPEWVQLNDIVEEIVTANQLGAQAKGLRLTYSSYDNLPAIWADRNQLIQIVNNLVSNAINYTVEGDVWVRTWMDGDGQVAIEVKDTGMGIAADDMPHLFERFYRGKQAGRSAIPGTGLGLAISKEMIELHQGDIRVASQPEVGTTITVLLPAGNGVASENGPTAPYPV